MILFRIIGLSLAKAKQAVCIRAAWLSRQLVSGDHLSVTVVSKNSPVDSSLGIPGSWTLLDSSVCCIPDSIGKNYPESGLLAWGASFAKSETFTFRNLPTFSCQRALRFLAV